MKDSKSGAKILKTFALTSAVLIILVFVVVPVIVTYFIDIDKYRPAVAEKLSEDIGKEVEIGRLSLSLIFGVKLTARDIVVKDPKIADRNMLSTSSVTAKVSLLHLFKSELGLKKIVIKAPEFNIVKYKDGSLNIAELNAKTEGGRELYGSTNGHKVIPAAFSPRDEKASPLKIKRIFVRSIEIEKGRFVYSAEKPEGKTSQPLELIGFSGIDLKVKSIKIPKETEGIGNPFEPDELSAEIDGEIEDAFFYETKISNVNLVGLVEGGKAVIEDLVFSIYNGTAKVKGVLRYAFENPSGELSIEGSDILFHELLNSLSDEENLVVGTMKLNGDFTFPLVGKGFTDGIVGRGSITVTDGTVPDFSIRTELAKSLNIPPAALPEKLDTGDFTSMGGGYYIKSGKLSTDDFETVGPTYNSTTRGYLGFDGALDFSGYIYPSEEIVESSLFEKITSLIGIGGKLTEIPFTVTGTLDNVKFKIEYEGLLKSGGNDGGDSKSLEDLGKSILEDILK